MNEHVFAIEKHETHETKDLLYVEVFCVYSRDLFYEL